MALYSTDMFSYQTEGTRNTCKLMSPPARAAASRYHPYMSRGARNSNTGPTSDYKGNFNTMEPFPESSNVYSFPTQHAWVQPTAWQSAGAGVLLANALVYQDYQKVQSRDSWVQDPMYAVRCLQDVCGSGTVNNTAVGVAIPKEQDHPFYWRRRSAPAEGMTRTRDKYRVVYTEKQRQGLEKEYEESKFITTQRKAELSKELNLSDRQIKIWFQNRRAKERRDSRKTSGSSNTSPVNRSTSESTAAAHSPEIFTSKADMTSSTSGFQMTSCRYAGNQTISPETYTIGQCRYENTGSVEKQTDICDNLDVNGLGLPISPSGWNSSPSNGFVPQLNVSPLTVNIDFGFVPRI